MTGPDAPIVYDDGRLFVVDKPPGPTSEDLAALLHGKLVHRLDRLTSGLLVLARDARTVQRMQRLRERGGLERTYLALVHGVVDAPMVLEGSLVRDRGDGLRWVAAADAADAQAARSEVEPRAARDDATIVVVKLHTGRTHQVRIHLAHAGHPIVGDDVYLRDWRAAGREVLPSSRLWLHAWRLRFQPPGAVAAITLEAPPPQTLTHPSHEDERRRESEVGQRAIGIVNAGPE